MKKILGLLAGLLLVPAVAFAASPVTIDGYSTGATLPTITTVGTVSSVTASNPDPVTYAPVTADGAVVGSACTFYGAAFKASAANMEIILYDNDDTANASTVIWQGGADADNGYASIFCSEGITCDTGIYGDITNGVGSVYYE